MGSTVNTRANRLLVSNLQKFPSVLNFPFPDVRGFLNESLFKAMQSKAWVLATQTLGSWILIRGILLCDEIKA
jgi:hypothetical protein